MNNPIDKPPKNNDPKAEIYYWKNTLVPGEMYIITSIFDTKGWSLSIEAIKKHIEKEKSSPPQNTKPSSTQPNKKRM